MSDVGQGPSFGHGEVFDAVSGYLGSQLESFQESVQDFQDSSQEWRRLFSELLGTFFLVLVAAGGGMMGQAFPGTISRTAAVVAPGLMVMAIILFMGKVSGAHLNPAVSIAFALRRDFPWWRVPGYIVVQLGGAVLAAWFLQAVVHVSATYGSNYPASSYSNGDAFWMELVLTLGLVSVILGTASGAQNIGIVGALGVGAYIALAGLWGSPISGTSMNPARTFGPDAVGADFHAYWVYVAGPLAGAAVAVAAVLVRVPPRGRSGKRSPTRNRHSLTGVTRLGHAARSGGMASARYVALLRGINVGGRNKVPMAELRSAFEDAGHTEVSTYIQSGNVLFRSSTPRASLQADVERMLERHLGYPIVVIVRSHTQLRSTVERAPASFGTRPTIHHSDAIFLRAPLTASQVMKLVRLREGVDRAWPGRGVVYFERLIAERTKSRMSSIVGTPEYANMTIRSWATTTKLLALLDHGN